MLDKWFPLMIGVWVAAAVARHGSDAANGLEPPGVEAANLLIVFINSCYCFYAYIVILWRLPKLCAMTQRTDAGTVYTLAVRG